MFLSYDKSNQFIKSLIEKCPLILEQSYNPPIYLKGGFLQTVFCKGVIPTHPKPRVREIFTIPAFEKPENATCCPHFVPEGIVSIDWLRRKNSKATVVIVPGLTGSSSDSYVMSLADHLADKNFSVACYNPRSRGGNKLISPFLYSAGYTEDLRWLLNTLHKRSPKESLIAVGFSLGANYLTKYLGEEGENCLLEAAVVIGGPLDSLRNSDYLARDCITRVCDRYLASSIYKMLHEFEDVLKKNPNVHIENGKKATSMYDVDEYLTSGMMGYVNAREYYIGCTSLPYVPKIKTVTLFVAAKNDPVIDYLEERLPEFENNPNVIRVLTKNGGHSMSWPMAPFGKDSWIDKVVSSFVDAKLSIFSNSTMKSKEIVLS